MAYRQPSERRDRQTNNNPNNPNNPNNEMLTTSYLEHCLEQVSSLPNKTQEALEQIRSLDDKINTLMNDGETTAMSTISRATTKGMPTENARRSYQELMHIQKNASEATDKKVSIAQSMNETISTIFADVERRLNEFEALLKKDGRWPGLMVGNNNLGAPIPGTNTNGGTSGSGGGIGKAPITAIPKAPFNSTTNMTTSNQNSKLSKGNNNIINNNGTHNANLNGGISLHSSSTTKSHHHHHHVKAHAKNNTDNNLPNNNNNNNNNRANIPSKSPRIGSNISTTTIPNNLSNANTTTLTTALASSSIGSKNVTNSDRINSGISVAALTTRASQKSRMKDLTDEEDIVNNNSMIENRQQQQQSLESKAKSTRHSSTQRKTTTSNRHTFDHEGDVEMNDAIDTTSIIDPNGNDNADDDSDNNNNNDSNLDEKMNTNGNDVTDNQLYCSCRNVSHGEMIACEAKNCPFEWYHFACVGLKEAPPKGSTWYCNLCTERMRRKSGGTRRKMSTT